MLVKRYRLWKISRTVREDRGSPELGENGLWDGGKLMLARESLLAQYSCIETIQ
jgi:hypothetical protein